ncbi:MAG: hypothetical protein PSV26_14285 [Polaromonas sp.]|uniref:hypothetical protein n=1 Tax=Polaromonas sp. TaxID=1869339 RepID=UPI002487C49D|nr:hypothetical protein [Polaromonas sp.]MDI1238646.1 hypothetical protein [Polaromonas sp.]
MQPAYLARLSQSVQEFVHKVEQDSGLQVEVFGDSALNVAGPLGQGRLEVSIEPRRLRLFVPTNGYFPDGAVRHEFLHIQRFHVQRVPKLALASAMRWDQGIAERLTDIDNALEHIVIVPLEIELHPERKPHWEEVMADVCGGLRAIPDSERRLAVCLHWAFLRYVLPDSPQVQVIQDFMKEHSLSAVANDFADQLLAVLESKEEMLRVLARAFPEIEREGAAMEYLRGLPGNAGS